MAAMNELGTTHKVIGHSAMEIKALLIKCPTKHGTSSSSVVQQKAMRLQEHSKTILVPITIHQ